MAQFSPLVAPSLYSGPLPPGLATPLHKQMLAAHVAQLQKKPAPGVPTAPVGTADQMTSDEQRVKDTQKRVDSQADKVANQGDFNPAPVQMGQQNPWAVVGQALAALVSPRLAPAMFAETDQFQKQAADQYERDIEKQRMEGQQYDRNVANQVRSLSAMQSMAADAEKVRNEDWTHLDKAHQQDYSWRMAQLKHQDSGAALKERYFKDNLWARNNAGRLAEEKQKDANALTIAGFRSRDAYMIAEYRGNITAAHYAMTDKLAALRIAASQATGNRRLAIQAKIGLLNATERDLANQRTELGKALTIIGTPNAAPDAVSKAKAVVPALTGQITATSKKVQAALGDPTLSLIPETKNIDGEADANYNALNAEAGAEGYPQMPGYGQPPVTNNITISPTVQGGQGATVTQAPPSDNTPPTDNTTPGGAGQMTLAQVQKLAKDHFHGNIKAAEDAARKHGVVPVGW